MSWNNAQHVTSHTHPDIRCTASRRAINRNFPQQWCNGQLLICVIFYNTCLVLFLVPWLATYQCLNETVSLSAASQSLTSSCIRAVFCHYLTGGRDTMQRSLAALSTETTGAPIKASFAPTGVRKDTPRRFYNSFSECRSQNASPCKRQVCGQDRPRPSDLRLLPAVGLGVCTRGRRKSEMSLDREGASPPVSISGYVKLGALARQQWSSRGGGSRPARAAVATRSRMAAAAQTSADLVSHSASLLACFGVTGCFYVE